MLGLNCSIVSILLIVMFKLSTKLLRLHCDGKASKKAANRRQRGAQKACSNVFSMFEQSQIQEFKEVG